MATMGAGLDRARDIKDRMQAMLDRFNGALGKLDVVLAAGSKLPVFGSACQFLRDCVGILGKMSEISQDVLDFGEMLIESVQHLQSIANVADQLEGAAAAQLNRLLEAVRDLIKHSCTALSKFGDRGWFMAMIKAAGSLKTFSKLSMQMKDKFQQIQTTLITAQLELTFSMKPFAAEAAVAKQFEAMLAKQGGDADSAADVVKATDALVKDEGAMQIIKEEAGLSDELFRAEMDVLHKELSALAAGQQRIESGVNILVSKQKAVDGKEAALEQNRIDPADVEPTGEEIGKGAYGKVTKVKFIVRAPPPPVLQWYLPSVLAYLISRLYLYSPPHLSSTSPPTATKRR